MTFLNKRFFLKKNTKENIDQNLFEIVTLEFEDDTKVTNGFSKLKNREVGAYIIKNVLDKNTIQAISDFNKKYVLDLYPQESGTMSYPESFIYDMYTGDLQESTLSNPEKLEKLFQKVTGINLIEIVLRALRKVDTQSTIVKKELANNKKFISIQFRYLNKGDSTQPILHIHCEDLHLHHAPNLNEALGDQKINGRILTWYIPIVKPQGKGGELLLYDLQYKKDHSRFTQNDKMIIKDSSGKEYDCSKQGIKRMKLDPSAGDMIIFNGGSNYHAIEPFEGSVNRLTIGSFLNTATDETMELFG